MRGGEPQRVMMTADAVGGVWAYALELARGLVAGGAEVLLATMGAPPSAAQRRAVARLRGVTLAVSDYALEWMPDPWRDVDRAGAWLLELAAQWRPDVVHLNGYAHAVLPWPAPVLVAAHSCVCSWHVAVHGTPAPPQWDEYRRRVRTGLCAADAIVAPSGALAAALARHYGPLPPIRVIRNGRAPREFRPRARKQPFVFAAGRLWDAAKNLAVLDAAAPRLPWPVIVAGPPRPPLGAPAPAMRHLRLLGPLPPRRLAALCGAAAIFAAPARYEPFGLAVLEAALAGCALVLGDIDSLRELWEEAAVFVPPGDPAAVADGLAALIADPRRRAALALRARARAHRLAPERMTAAYREAYAALAAMRSPDAEAVSCMS